MSLDNIAAPQAVAPTEEIAGLIAERDALKRHCENLAAMVEDRMKDTRLVSAGGRGEGFGFDLMGGPIPYIAEYLVQFMGLRDGAATNYSEMEVQHNEFGALTLTIQRRSGKTPHQLRKEAEDRLTASEAEAADLRRRLEEAREALRVIATGSGYEWSETREQLHRIIDAAVECANNALRTLMNSRARIERRAQAVDIGDD